MPKIMAELGSMAQLIASIVSVSQHTEAVITPYSFRLEIQYLNPVIPVLRYEDSSRDMAYIMSCGA